MNANVAQYVGVAAVTTPVEIDALLGMLDRVDWPSQVRFMNGPLVSRKTLLGQPASDPTQYPPFKLVPGLLPDDARCFNVIHFNSRDRNLADQLFSIAELPNLHGVQLNILWPALYLSCTYACVRFMFGIV